MKLKKIFDKPKIIGICSDVNQGKSNMVYHMINELRKNYNFNLYSYGLRNDLSEQKIYSVEELETIKNSIIFADEFFTLFDLEDRKKRRSIENSLRLINHNNNILVLCGLPENFKKFVSAKVDEVFFKKCNIADFINGSSIKKKCINYKGNEMGSTILNLEIHETLYYDGFHYSKFEIPYYSKYDTKRSNEPILKNVVKSVQKNVVKKNV